MTQNEMLVVCRSEASPCSRNYILSSLCLPLPLPNSNSSYHAYPCIPLNIRQWTLVHVIENSNSGGEWLFLLKKS